MRVRTALAALLSLALWSGGAAAQSVADFYKGKTVTLITGFPPGGGYDTYMRVLQRHFSRFIPGNPTVIVQNMAGAGSLTAANYLYAKAPADGTVIGIFASSAAMEPMLGNKDAVFDATKFSWIGSMSQDVAYCGSWDEGGHPPSFNDMMTKKTIIGGGAQAAITFQHPMILKTVLHANIDVIPGYPGTRELYLAMQKGEISGMCGLFASSIKSQFKGDMASGKMRLFIQMGPKKSTEFGDIPSVYDYAKSDEDRAVLDIHFKQLLLGRPLAGPPGIPADRLKALRDGLVAVLKDKDFLADSNQAGLDVDYASPDQVLALLADFAKFRPEIFEKAKKAIGR
jgi:tripartite-type tricarboxylate transporter receptor subunit TctC